MFSYLRKTSEERSEKKDDEEKKEQEKVKVRTLKK